MRFVKVSLVLSLFAHGLHLTDDVHLSVRKPSRAVFEACFEGKKSGK